HAPVLIVGMRGDHDQAGARVQFLQALPQRRRSAVDPDLMRNRRRLYRSAIRQLRKRSSSSKNKNSELHRLSMLPCAEANVRNKASARTEYPADPRSSTKSSQSFQSTPAQHSRSDSRNSRDSEC